MTPQTKPMDQMSVRELQELAKKAEAVLRTKTFPPESDSPNERVAYASPPKEDYYQFRDRMTAANPPGCVLIQEATVWPTGDIAIQASEQNAFGQWLKTARFEHRPPPANDFARLNIIRDYWLAILKIETEAFKQFKKECVEKAGLAMKYANMPGPGESEKQQLRDGIKRIETFREKLTETEKAITQTVEYRERVVNMTEASRREAERIAELRSFTAFSIDEYQ